MIEDWSDRAFVLEAVRKDGMLLKKASDELLRDREIVFTAVKQNGYAVQYSD